MERETQRTQHADVEATTPQETTLTPSERRFVKDAKRIIGNHLTRTILIVSAVLASAGIVAVEKSDSFDPLANSANSASHLVLNGLNRAYDQLIDKLPGAEKAYAMTSKPFCLINRSGATQTSLWLTFDSAGVANVNFLSGTENCTDVTTDVNQEKFNCSGTKQIYAIESETGCGFLWQYPCCQGHGNLTPCTATETFGYDLDTYDLKLAGEQGVGWDWGSRPAGQSPSQAVGQEQTTDCSSVGGIAELPDLSNSPQNIDSQPSKDNTVPIAAGLAGAAAALGAGGALLFIRKKRSA